MAEEKPMKTSGIAGLELGKQGYLDGKRPAAIFQELTGVNLVQFAVFPEQLRSFKTSFKRQTGITDLPQMSSSIDDEAGLVVRPELTKFWLLRPSAAADLDISALEKYFPLDLTGSRVFLKISGEQAQTVINRFCAVDLSGADGQFLATGFHHVPMHILKQTQDQFVFILPRGFSESLAETLHHTARQFGVEVKRPADWARTG